MGGIQGRVANRVSSKPMHKEGWCSSSGGGAGSMPVALGGGGTLKLRAKAMRSPLLATSRHQYWPSSPFRISKCSPVIERPPNAGTSGGGNPSRPHCPGGAIQFRTLWMVG